VYVGCVSSLENMFFDLHLFPFVYVCVCVVVYREGAGIH